MTERAWSIMTKSQGGTVSVIRDLTLDECRQMYERLDPWYGMHTTQNNYTGPDGSVSLSCNGMHVGNDGDIEVREVFGPPTWDRNEINKWPRWPKITIVEVDKDGKPLVHAAA